MTLKTEGEETFVSFSKAKNFSDLYIFRRKVVQVGRGNEIWNRFDPFTKTILNISFANSDPEVDMADYRMVQSQLGEILGLTTFDIRRITAIETQTLARSVKTTTPINSSAKNNPPNSKIASTNIVDKAEGIVIAENGQQYNFTEIYSSYQSKIYNHLYRIYGDQERAMSDTQEVFTRFWTKIGSIEDDDFYIGPYLYRIATNIATDQLRRDKLIRFSSISDLTREDGSDKSDGVFLKSSELPKDEDPFKVIIDQSDRAIIHQALKLLPPRYQWVFTLIDFDNLSMLEAAEVFESSRSAMKSLHFRASHELRRILESEFGLVSLKTL